MSTSCKTIGVIGSSYLFEAEDLLSRLEALKSISNTAGLRLYQTKENLMNVEIILKDKQKSSKRITKNNIMINVYNGDLSDFSNRYISNLNSEGIGCITVAPRDSFFSISKLLNSFSNLRSDTDSRPIWFHSFDNSLWLSCSDKLNSNTGACMASIRLCPSFSSFDFGLIGRQLFKSLYLFYQDVDFYLLPDKVTLKTNSFNTSILSRVPPEYALYLTKGAPKTILPTSERSQSLYLESTRSFPLTQLLQAVYLSKPKNTASNYELSLSLSDSILTISKLSDSKLLEHSQVSLYSSSHSIGSWFDINANYNMLISSLKLLKEYCDFCKKESGISSTTSPNTEFDIDDLDNDDLNPSLLQEEEHEFVTLCSLYSQTGKKATVYYLLLTVLPNFFVSDYRSQGCIAKIQVKPRLLPSNL